MQELTETIAEGRAMANKPGGYGALNGSPEVKKFIETGEILLKDVKYVVLTTDGFTSLEHGENKVKFIELFNQTKSLSDTLKIIRDLEEQDTLCLKHPRIKKHDDATGIAITF